MVGLQGHWGERFGGTFLDDFSLHRACRATGDCVLEGFLYGPWLKDLKGTPSQGPPRILYKLF